MHLTAASNGPAIRQTGISPAGLEHVAGHLNQYPQPNAAVAMHQRPANLDLVFLSYRANLLEFELIAFHYCVTGRVRCQDSMPFGYVGGGCLDALGPAAKSDAMLSTLKWLSINMCVRSATFRLWADNNIYPVPMHSAVMNDPFSPRYQSDLGPVKEEFVQTHPISSQRKQPDVTSANVSMMRIGENIHAIHPPCATVALILHSGTPPNVTDRGNTFNNGAADADGR